MWLCTFAGHTSLLWLHGRSCVLMGRIHSVRARKVIQESILLFQLPSNERDLMRKTSLVVVVENAFELIAAVNTLPRRLSVKMEKL